MKLLKVAIIIIIVIAIGAGGIFIAVYNTASKLIDQSIAELAGDDLISELSSTPVSIDQANTPTESNVTQVQPEVAPPQDTDTPKPEVLPSSQQNAVQSKKTDSTAGSKPVEAKKEIPMKEKLEVTKIVVSKLSTPELNELKDMAAGGVSKQEKAKAKELIYSKFTKEEIDYFKEIYNKYVK